MPLLSHKATLPVVAVLIAAAVVVVWLTRDSSGCNPGETRLRYTDEYPGICYAGVDPGGRLGALAARLERGEVEPDYHGERGYLDAVLAELNIDAVSQVLVFSRTSLQTGLIRPETPRAIYFNDDTYVAWIPGAPTLEFASYDPELGPVFYTLRQDVAEAPVMERQFSVCLRCHDTYGMSGGGVPRFLVGSGYTGTDGELVSHEAWILTRQATTLRNRWGGWYVTGNHGDAVHLGNIVVERAEDLQELEALRVGNVDELGTFFDTSDYLTATSDIAALLVLEHQIEVQNLISRLRYESAGRPENEAGPLDGYVEDLVRAMLMVDEAGLPAPVAGREDFVAQFEVRGPFDTEGRSLRQLDLGTRVFRFPLSFLIYSPAFEALPPRARDAVFARLREVLAATPEQDGFERLTVADRIAIAEILAATLPEFAGA